ncbi:MAG: CHAT domain-containing tetratricopeptide repeat protein, partial [Cyanobacteria bacterium J06555_13]
ALMSLGIAYLALGDYERAIDSMQEALDITRQSELASLGRPGSTYDAFDYERAIDFLQEVLDSARQRHRLDELASLRRLGSASDALDYEQTRDFYQQSLDLARQLGNRPFEQIALVNLGLMHLVFDDYDLAIDSTQQALDLARQSGHRLVEGVSLHNLGLAFRGLDNLAEAAQYFESSALVQESLHSKGLADAHRLSLLDSQQVTYLLWQMTLMAQGQPQPALAVAERGRAQALAASMSRALTTENDAAWTPPAPPTLEQIQAIAIQQQATLVEYAVLPNGRILIWVIQPDGTIHATESDAQALDDSLEDTVALFADLGQNGRGGPPPETPLSDLVQDTQAALTTVRGTPSNATQLSRQDLDNNLKQLHNALIDPIQQWLPTDETQRVIFIPHRELFRVPFAALKDDQDTFLIEKHTLLTAPSIQSLALARQHSDRIQTANATDALIVGNPTLPNALTASYGWKQLPGAEDEAGKVGDTLSNYLGTDINALTQNEATETAVKQRLHTARFIHLATHGTLASGAADSNPKPETETSGAEDNSQPPAAPTTNGLQYSTIPGVLALAATGEDDGALTADELLEMTISNPLNAELVVLSACQTGQGPITSDGVYGLSRTLLTAGVPTLVVSLWNASDTHTVDLMDEFYRQFLEQDQDKAQALRQAMLKMINEGDPNPQYWAAFTLVGVAQ